MEWIVEAETLGDLIGFNWLNYVDGHWTASTKPLVRCKDCKHSYIEADGRRCCSTILDDRSTTDDWFCKDGERKDDEYI